MGVLLLFISNGGICTGIICQWVSWYMKTFVCIFFILAILRSDQEGAIGVLKKKLAVWKMEQFYTPSPHYNNTCRHTWRLTFSTSSSYFCKNITKVEDGGDSWIRQSKWWVNWKPGFWAKKKTNWKFIPFLPFFSAYLMIFLKYSTRNLELIFG